MMSETQTTSSDDAGDEIAAAAAAQLAPMAALVEASFAEMGRSVTEELARASAEGRQSVRDMVDGILEDLARLAAEELVRKPLQDALRGPGREAPDSVLGDVVGDLIKRSVRNG